MQSQLTECALSVALVHTQRDDTEDLTTAVERANLLDALEPCWNTSFDKTDVGNCAKNDTNLKDGARSCPDLDFDMRLDDADSSQQKNHVDIPLWVSDVSDVVPLFLDVDIAGDHGPNAAVQLCAAGNEFSTLVYGVVWRCFDCGDEL